MHIDDLKNTIQLKMEQIRRSTSRYNSDKPISIAIYMSYEHSYLIKHEIYRTSNDPTTRYAYEFFHHNTILGFQVYTVCPTNRNHCEVEHPPFRLVDLNAS